MRWPVASLALFVAVGVASCSLASPRVATAPEEAFPAEFEDSTGWEQLSDIRVPGNPGPFPSLDAAVRALDAFFEAGIRSPRPGSGASITVPEGALSAEEVHLFITVLGGATDVSSGMQVRVVLNHDQRGWWIDPTGESRRYCDQPLAGPFGHSCY